LHVQVGEGHLEREARVVEDLVLVENAAVRVDTGLEILERRRLRGMVRFEVATDVAHLDLDDMPVHDVRQHLGHERPHRDRRVRGPVLA
jgi:hypothetical protein